MDCPGHIDRDRSTRQPSRHAATHYRTSGCHLRMLDTPHGRWKINSAELTPTHLVYLTLWRRHRWLQWHGARWSAGPAVLSAAGPMNPVSIASFCYGGLFHRCTIAGIASFHGASQ